MKKVMTISFVLILAVALSLSFVSGQFGGGSSTCESDEDCGSNEVCNSGYCFHEAPEIELPTYTPKISRYSFDAIDYTDNQDVEDVWNGNDGKTSCSDPGCWGPETVNNSELSGLNVGSKAVNLSKGSIKIPDNDSLSPQKFAIMAWVKPESFGDGDEDYIVSKWRDSEAAFDSQYALKIESDEAFNDQFAFVVRNSSGEDKVVKSPKHYDSDDQTRWYHVAGVYNGTEISIYVDGMKQESKVHKGGLRDISGSDFEDYPLAIGSALDSNDDPVGSFDGLIDDVRIYGGGEDFFSIDYYSLDSFFIDFIEDVYGNSSSYPDCTDNDMDGWIKESSADSCDQTAIVASSYNGASDCNDNDSGVGSGEDSDGDGWYASAGCNAEENGKDLPDCDDSNADINPDSVWVKDTGETKTQCQDPGEDWTLKQNIDPIETSSFYWEDSDGNKISSLDVSDLPETVNMVADYGNTLGSNHSISFNVEQGIPSDKNHLDTISSSNVNIESSGSGDSVVARASYEIDESFVEDEFSSLPGEMHFRSAYNDDLFSSAIKNDSEILEITNKSVSASSCDIAELKKSNFSRSGSCGSNDFVDFTVDNSACHDDLLSEEGYPVKDLCDYNGLGVIGNVSQTNLDSVYIGEGELDNSENYTAEGPQNVVLSKDGSHIAFEHDFSEEPLNLYSLVISTSNEGSSGIERGKVNFHSQDRGVFEERLTEVSDKAILLSRINESDRVCIVDEEGTSFVSSNCNASGEVLVDCPGSSEGYTCNITNNGSHYRVEPLDHSTVKEFVEGDGSVACTESDWSCGNWSSCQFGQESRECTKINSCSGGFQPNETQSCGSGDGQNFCVEGEHYECTDWSDCSDGEQTRACTQTADCSNYDPQETRSCGSDSADGVTSQTSGNDFPWMIVLIAGGILLVGIIVLVIVLKSRSGSSSKSSSGKKSQSGNRSKPSKKRQMSRSSLPRKNVKKKSPPKRPVPKGVSRKYQGRGRA